MDGTVKYTRLWTQSYLHCHCFSRSTWTYWKVTWGHNIVADVLAGAFKSTPTPNFNSPTTHKDTHIYNSWLTTDDPSLSTSIRFTARSRLFSSPKETIRDSLISIRRDGFVSIYLLITKLLIIVIISYYILLVPKI